MLSGSVNRRRIGSASSPMGGSPTPSIPVPPPPTPLDAGGTAGGSTAGTPGGTAPLRFTAPIQFDIASPHDETSHAAGNASTPYKGTVIRKMGAALLFVL